MTKKATCSYVHRTLLCFVTIVFQISDNKIFKNLTIRKLNDKKSLIFKYDRMQKGISSRLVCGSRGMCLDCTWPGFKSPLGWDFFLHPSHLIVI